MSQLTSTVRAGRGRKRFSVRMHRKTRLPANWKSKWNFRQSIRARTSVGQRNFHGTPCNNDNSMKLLRLSISPCRWPRFSFVSCLPLFLLLMSNGTRTNNGWTGSFRSSVRFAWYCDCAISDELVKLAQSAVRLHVTLTLSPSLCFLPALRACCFLGPPWMAGEPQTVRASTTFLKSLLRLAS